MGIVKNYNSGTYKPFWYDTKRDIMLGTSPKCGATTFQIWAKAHGLLHCTHGNAYDCWRYFFVRDPLERFISLYRDKCRDGNVQSRVNTALIKGKSLEELLFFIESKKVWDQHWGLQSEILGDVEVILLPLELMSSVLEMDKHNTSEGEVDLSQDIIDRVYAHYDEDRELYEKARAFGLTLN